MPLPHRRTRVLRAVALLAAAAVLILVAYTRASTPGPEAPRWLPSLPWHARLAGYGLFRLWERGRAPAHVVVPSPDPGGPLLVDRWHARKQPYDSFLRPGVRDYDQMHGLGRAFDSSRQAGVEFRELGIGLAWDAPTALGGGAALFINLPSGDGPGFRWSEVRAIAAFVRAGGGLLLITDHTNCYAHQDMLSQLAQALDFRLIPATAADPVQGLGPRAASWIRATDVGSHPVTKGVVVTGWMNAGALEGLTPLIRSSPSSWADRGEPGRRDDSSGFTGDLHKGEGEMGPVTLAIAGTVGAGRVVVLADQNAFGATMIGYGDNQRLFNNALGWVMGRDLTLVAPEVVTVGRGCADAYEEGFRSFQVAIAAVARDSCEGATDARVRVILPSAVETLPAPNTRTVRMRPGVPELPARWDEKGKVGSRTFLVDARGTPVLFELGGELIVAASLLNNTSLGNERQDPTIAEFVLGHQVKQKVVAWLLGGSGVQPTP